MSTPSLVNQPTVAPSLSSTSFLNVATSSSSSTSVASPSTSQTPSSTPIVPSITPTTSSSSYDTATVSQATQIFSSATVSAGNSSSSSVENGSGSRQSLSAGAVAGIAIGCVVIGTGLAFALILLLGWRPSKSSKRRKESSRHVEPFPKNEKPRGAAAKGDVTRPLLTSAAVAAQPRNSIEPFLAQQADDATVRQKYLVVFDQIELHVDNFYADRAVELTPEQEGELSRFGTKSMTMPLAGLLQSSHRKTAVIKHCLAFYTIGLVTPSNNSDCLLPPELAGILAPPRAEAGRPSGDQKSPLALSRWRMLTAYLRPNLFNENAMSSLEDDQRIHDRAARFSRVFAPFSSPESSDQQVKHLVEVFRSAAKTALWLLAQPSTFQFAWERGNINRAARTLETVPALWKTHDADGVKIDPPQTIYSVITKRI